jgi:hypothetical protein
VIFRTPQYRTRFSTKAINKMKKSNIKKLLKKSLESKVPLSFFRTFTSTRQHGYVLSFTDDFVLIHQTYNLCLDGYAVLPLNTIKKIRCNVFEEMYGYIMQKESLLTDLGIAYTIDLTNWQTIFNSIIQHKEFAAIRCEQSWISIFILGKLTNAKKKKVEILYLEADGIYEEFISEQKYKYITIVRFDELYHNLFQKYGRYKNQILPK